MNEKMKLNFDFYYGKDAEQFNFYCNSDTNNTKYNNTNFNDNNHITSFQQGDVSDVIRYRELYQEIITKNIEYDVIFQNYGENYANEILETILDAVCCRKDYTTKIHNIKSYMITFTTIDCYYRAKVNNELYGNV